MGLLTDPSAGQGKISKALIKYYPKLCILLFISGIVWFCVLAYTPVNLGTYFSENALLPGLVKVEFREDDLAKRYHEELVDEMKDYKDSIPYPWLLAKLRQIGLDVYTHNFTLNYPLGKPQKFTGKNVYGILRAPRASSTESLVLSVPYRPPSSVHLTTAPSVAIMLAFAKYAVKEKYWAKDIIFLITEHEQLGIQAWLEAYHGVFCGNEGVLDHGDLIGRAGSIQAAINLELHDINVAQIDIKIEGLNGQLPNLDLFNLAAKMCMKEGIIHTFKNRVSRSFKPTFKSWLYSFKTLMAMVTTQATGIPNGNHGLFHRFGIEALTMEGFPTTVVRSAHKAGFLILGRLLEDIFRSLNNLLERFHQSYFFYLLPSSERFVSIGLYIPSVCLLATALLIKASAKWCILQEILFTEKTKREESLMEDKNNEEESDVEDDDPTELGKQVLRNIGKTIEEEIKSNADETQDEVNVMEVISAFVFAHFLGILILYSPEFLARVGNSYNMRTETSIFFGLIFISFLVLFTPFFIQFRYSNKSMIILNILSLLELGTALICISMNNFSLALLLSVVYVPVSLLINPSESRFYSAIQKFLWLLVHPLAVLSLTVLIYTFISFPSEANTENLVRSLTAAKQSIVFAIVDSMIYGNWLYSVVASILFPNWVCFWFISFGKQENDNLQITQEKKVN